jgi:3-phosphoglycerate kinase
MLNKKSVDDIQVKGKRVLVRCDLTCHFRTVRFQTKAVLQNPFQR